MNNRIKAIRLKHKLSQDDFGNRIGIKRSSVSLLESGKNNPAERTIKLICQEFDVNEHWLRTGEGIPSAIDSMEERYARNLAKLQHTDEEIIINLINLLAESDSQTLFTLKQFLQSLLGTK